MFQFCAYGQILKFFFHAYFLKNKLQFYHVLKIKNRYRNQFMIIH
jgi:hypothetical protein